MRLRLLHKARHKPSTRLAFGLIHFERARRALRGVVPVNRGGNKRRKEMERQQKQREKEAARRRRREDKKTTPESAEEPAPTDAVVAEPAESASE